MAGGGGEGGDTPMLTMGTLARIGLRVFNTVS